jgi:hypothetical protein
VDGNATEVWDPEAQPCDQPQYKDFTGVDSLSAFFVSLCVFISVQTIEHHMGEPLFTLAGLEGYIKEGVGHKTEEALKQLEKPDPDAGEDSVEKDEADTGSGVDSNDKEQEMATAE